MCETVKMPAVALRHIMGETFDHGFEAGGQAGPWERIADAEGMIRAAMRQGITLEAAEAAIILGYLEGHEYSLMADAGGRTMCHDEQYGDDHSEDRPYSIRDAVEFCHEMNAGLLHDNLSRNEPDEGFLSQLRKDEQILNALMERPALWLGSIEEGYYDEQGEPVKFKYRDRGDSQEGRS